MVRSIPLAHLQQPDITVDKVMSSQMLWDPIRYDETCPSSDGRAVVIGDEQAADDAVAQGNPVAWVHADGDAHRTVVLRAPQWGEPAGQPQPAARCGRAGGISDPLTEIDAAEICVPFSWFEPMWLESLGFAPEGEGGSSPRPGRRRSAASCR